MQTLFNWNQLKGLLDNLKHFNQSSNNDRFLIKTVNLTLGNSDRHKNNDHFEHY